MKKIITYAMVLICILSLSYNIFFELREPGFDRYIATYAVLYGFVTRPAFYFSVLFVILNIADRYINNKIDKLRHIFIIISSAYMGIYIIMVIFHILWGMGEYWRVLKFISDRMEIFAVVGALMGIGLGRGKL